MLDELAEKGLVEKIIAKPAKFRAIPLSDGLQELLRRRQEKTEKLAKEAEWISKAVQAFPVIDEDIGEFRIIPKKQPIEKMSHEIFLTAKASVDLMNETQEVLNIHERHLESKKTALKNGVRVREIIGKSAPDAHLPVSLLNLVKASPLLEIKLLDSPPTAKLMIKDSKEIILATSSKPGAFSQSSLWTNNPIIVQIVQQWYDSVWSRAEAILTSP